ncbi:MAG: hypothetical protein HC942_20420 [Microcoleus sp. SU_5_6]|nr:hypothetical protein [Microcoleus sp. SU_5_6]
MPDSTIRSSHAPAYRNPDTFGVWVIPLNNLPIPNSQFPIPNSQLPIPNSQFPIPNSQFPKRTSSIGPKGYIHPLAECAVWRKLLH